MSNETKQDVFEKMKWELISNLANTIYQNGGLRPLEDATKVGENYATRYADALPDNLPVIPEAVGEYLKTHRKDLLGEIFWKIGCKSSAFLDSNELYIVLNSDTFARAWVLGIWRVEETGEIVKLEEN